MKIGGIELKRLTSTVVLALVALSGGCSHGQASNGPAVAGPGVLADIAAFRAKPNDATWEPVHNDLVRSAPSADSQSSLIQALSGTDIPRAYVEAAAIDLADTDFQGAVRWIRLVNVAARTDPSPAAQAKVRRSAFLAWLVLALRTSIDSNGVDMTQMDLRCNEKFVGQGANFDNVDFSGSIFSAGTWRYVTLTDARFDGAQTNGPLLCANCIWGRQPFPGTMALQRGVWGAP
jgi:hypothetical protein